MSGQVLKLGLKYWKLRARKLTLMSASLTSRKLTLNKINANLNDSR